MTQHTTTSPALVRVDVGGCPPGSSSLQLDSVRRQRQGMQNLESFSDVVRGSRFASPIKAFLYGWNILIILLGLVLLCVGLYFLYYEDNAHLVPALSFNLATYMGLALAFVSGLGLYGVQQQRQCVTDGRRNYALGAFVLISFVGAGVVIVGGVIALTLRTVAENASQDELVNGRTREFESAMISKLHTYATENPSGWLGVQKSNHCCAYASVSNMIEDAETPWGEDDLTMVRNINSMAGRYCATTASECVHDAATSMTSGSSERSTLDELPCPKRGHQWCRDAVLDGILTNYRFIGFYAIAIGCCQVRRNPASWSKP